MDRRFWILAALLCLSTPLWARELIVVFAEDYAPVSFVDHGELIGVGVDLVKAMAAREGISVVLKGLPWVRAQSEVRSGEADAFVCTDNPERESYAVLSAAALFSVHVMAVTAKNNPRLGELRAIRTFADAAQYPQVNLLGSGLSGLLGDARVCYLANAQSVFEFLLLGRADLYLDSDLNLSYNAARLHLLGQLEFLPPVFQVTAFRLGISKHSPFVSDLPRWSRDFEAMENDGTVAAVLAKFQN